MSAGATAGGSAAAGMIQAVRAMGTIVQVEPDEFTEILYRQEGLLVVHSTSWMFGTRHEYLTSYKGLTFFCRVRHPLELPADIEVVESRKIWIPGAI